MRVVLLSIGSILTLIAILFAVRIYGLSRQYQPFEHVFLQQKLPWLVVRVASQGEAQSIVRAAPDAILWLDLVKTFDHKVLHLSDENIQQRLVEASFRPGQWKGPFFDRYTLDEIRPLFPDASLIADFLALFPQQKMILNLTSNSRDFDADLVENLKNSAGVADRILIQSPVDVVIKSIKYLQPLWLYGTSQPDLVKLLTLESVYILPAAPFIGDVFISPLTIHGRPAFNAEVLNEMRRRQKRILLGPLSTSSEYTAARNNNPDGYVFATPELALKLFER